MRPRALLIVTVILTWSGDAAAQAPAAARAAVAETRIDLDGDGALDLVRIEHPPAVTVRFAGGQQAWRPFATSTGALVQGTLTAGAGPRFGGHGVVVATGVFRKGRSERREAMVLAWRGGALDKLWEGQVGLQGPDGEHAIHVEATPRGLLRYQSRPDIYRCDRQPAPLFPEAYDFRAGRFRPVFNAPRMPANAPVLRATRTPPPGALPPPGAAVSTTTPATGTATGAATEPATGTPAAPPAVVFRTRAASIQAGAAHAGHLAPPRALDDGDPTTVWREDLGGNGQGELITLTTNMPGVRVMAVRIVPGDAADPARFRRGNRLARVGLLVGPDRAFWLEIPTDPAAAGPLARTYRQAYWAVLPEPVPADCVTLVLDTVHPGTAAASARAGDTVIADLAVLTDLELSPGGAEDALVARVLAGGAAGRTAIGLLAGRGRPAAEALVQAAAAARTPDERRRLRRALARVGHPVGAPALAEGLAAPGTSAADRDDFASALARMGEDAIAPLAALLGSGNGSDGARRAAAEALGSMSAPAARDALLAAAGRGSRLVRRTVAVQLGRRPDTDMPALLDAAAARARPSSGAGPDARDGAGPSGEPGAEPDAEHGGGPGGDQGAEPDGEHGPAGHESGREADMWRAIGLMARHAATEARTQAAVAMARRLETASDYELLYRLLPAAAHLDHDPLLAALESALGRLPGPSARTDALRRVTASALGSNPAPRARALLAAMLSAPDPGLRRRAVQALGERRDGDQDADRALAARLGSDPWPGIRTAAATALGHRCPASISPMSISMNPAGPPASSAAGGAAGGAARGGHIAREHLERALNSDPEVSVRLAALGALVSCQPPGQLPGLGERLLHIAADREQPADVRQRAITLTGSLGERAPGISTTALDELTQGLLALFGQLRRQAWSDAGAVRLAAATAAALGRLGHARAVEPLLAAARDEAFPALQAAAITGLSATCPPALGSLLDRYAQSDQRPVALAVRRARERCH